MQLQARAKFKSCTASVIILAIILVRWSSAAHTGWVNELNGDVRYRIHYENDGSYCETNIAAAEAALSLQTVDATAETYYFDMNFDFWNLSPLLTCRLTDFDHTTIDTTGTMDTSKVTMTTKDWGPNSLKFQTLETASLLGYPSCD